MYCIFLEVVLHVSVQLKFCQLCYIIIIAHSKCLCELQGFFICNLMQNILHVHLLWPGLHMFAMIEHVLSLSSLKKNLSNHCEIRNNYCSHHINCSNID